MITIFTYLPCFCPCFLFVSLLVWALLSYFDSLMFSLLSVSISFVFSCWTQCVCVGSLSDSSFVLSDFWTPLYISTSVWESWHRFVKMLIWRLKRFFSPNRNKKTSALLLSGCMLAVIKLSFRDFRISCVCITFCLCFVFVQVLICTINYIISFSSLFCFAKM